MTERLFWALASCTFLISACGVTTPGSSIEGAWELEGGFIDGRPISIVDGYPITLTIEDGTLSGRAACNGYGGTYTLASGRLTLGDLAWTEMACMPTDVMTSEADYLAALIRVDTVEMGSSLSLTGDDAELVFAALDPVPVSDLVGTVWVLDSLIQGDAVSSVGGERATLELFTDGSLIGSTGCRSLRGEYVVSGATVSFTTFGADGECPVDLKDQDSLVVTVLGDGFSVSIDGDTLTVTSMGNEGLIYKSSG
jgi:heat shock protein HslJ